MTVIQGIEAIPSAWLDCSPLPLSKAELYLEFNGQEVHKDRSSTPGLLGLIILASKW